MLNGLHIEPTNHCTLRCPRCERTQFISQFGSKVWRNQELDLRALMAFVDVDLTGKLVTFCGNLGDPIYHSEFHDMVSWAKSLGSRIQIDTNGSYRSVEWWADLAKILDHADTVNFSVDGTPENFTEYRVNADWSSIKLGMEVMAACRARIVWKFIPFSFNEDKINAAVDMARDLGLEFQLSPSDRWIKDDPLKPKNYLGPREQVLVSWKNREINPLCMSTQQEHFISHDGYYLPCCYSKDHRFYYKTDFYKNRSAYDISTTVLSEQLVQMQNYYASVAGSRPQHCQFNCGKP